MNKKKNLISNLLLFCTLLLTAVSCTEETENMGQPTSLTMNIMVKTDASRAVIENGTLPDGSLVGVTVVDAGGKTYDGTDYTNIKGTTSGTTLSLASEVMITDNAATVYAYYPWASGVSETAVPLAAGQTDYLYADPVTGVNNDNATGSLSMNHALACLRITIRRGGYTGTGALTTFSVSSDALSTAGTLNARTGAVTTTGSGTYETNLSQTIGDDAVVQDILVVPTGKTGDMTFTLLVDGNEYNVTASNVTLAKGGMYEYELEIEKMTWDTAPNGVYAVAADGSPVTVEDADESCIGVALIVNDAPTPQRLMIEKNGEANTTSIKAAYTADGATDIEYKTFYWGPYSMNVVGITSWVDGSSEKAPTDYKTWENYPTYVWNDYNGKENTAALQSVTDTDTYTTYANMATWCTKFNATPSENQGYTDWYIPAVGQCLLISINVTIINNVLTKIGGTTFAGGFYWSSSQNDFRRGWFVALNSCYASSENKSYNSYSNFCVRLVRDL